MVLFWATVFSGGCSNNQSGGELAATDAASQTTTKAEPDQADYPALAHMPVGDDPAASLARTADAVRAAIERFDKVDKLIRPPGWNRQRMAVLAVHSAMESADGPARGIVRVLMQDRFSQIRPTRDEAAGDEELLPRRPMPTREEMLDDRSNPERQPVELAVRYEVRDGLWVHTAWEVPGKLALGNDWLDRIGAP